MRAVAVFALATMGAMLAGAVSAVGLEAPPRAAAADLTLTIPLGRVGDEVAYDVQVAFFDGEYDYGLDATYQLVFRADGIHRIADQTGMLHDTVRLLWNRSTPDGGYWCDGAHARMVEFVDLETRDLLRNEKQCTPGATPENDVTITNFGPNLHYTYSSHHLANYTLVRHQGRSYALPVDLSNRTRGADLKSLDWDSWLYWTDYFTEVTVLDATYRSAIEESAIIGARQAFALKTTLQLEFLRGELPDSGSPGHPPYPVSYSLERTEWLSPDLPYPVRTDVRENSSGHDFNSTYRETRLLVDYRPGSSPIPWGEDVASSHYRASDPGLERATGERGHPRDGASVRLPYPLALALQNVNADATLTQFAEWKRAHPRPDLVGVTYRAGASPRLVPGTDGLGAAANVQTWEFVYADLARESPSPPSFVVTSERQLSSGSVLNREWGLATYRAYFNLSADLLVEAPITLSAADGLWRLYASPEFLCGGPNYVSWGLGVFYQAVSPDAGAYARVMDERSAKRFNVLVYGFQAGGDTSGTIGGVRVPQSEQVSYVEIDLATGHLLMGWQFNRTQLLPSVGVPSALPEAPESRPAAGSAAPTSSSLLPAALVSASLLGLFLAAYFYPLLKFVGGQFATFLPGYAKLRKSELLNNRVRDGLLALIRGDPGISPPALHRALGGGWSTIVYHLSILESNKLVSSLIDGRHKRFFPADTVDWSRRGHIAALKNDRTKALYDLILEDPGVVQRDLVRRLGISQPATLWHTDRLVKSGLVGREKQGHRVHYYPLLASTPADPKSAVEVA